MKKQYIPKKLNSSLSINIGQIQIYSYTIPSLLFGIFSSMTLYKYLNVDIYMKITICGIVIILSYYIGNIKIQGKNWITIFLNILKFILFRRK